MIKFALIQCVKITLVACTFVKGQNVALESRTIPNEINPYTINWSPKEFIADIRKKTDNQKVSPPKTLTISTASQPLDRDGVSLLMETNSLKNYNKMKTSVNSNLADSLTKNTSSTSIMTTTPRILVNTVKATSKPNTSSPYPSSKPTRVFSRFATKSVRNKIAKTPSSSSDSVERKTVDLKQKANDDSRPVRTTLKSEPKTSPKLATNDRIKEQIASTVKTLLKIHKKTTTKPTTQTTTITIAATETAYTTTPVPTSEQTTTPKTTPVTITSSKTTSKRSSSSKNINEAFITSTDGDLWRTGNKTRTEQTFLTQPTTLNESTNARSSAPVSFQMVTISPMMYSSLAPIIIQVSPAAFMYDDVPKIDATSTEDPPVTLSTPDYFLHPKADYWSKNPIWYLIQPQALRYQFPFQQFGIKPGFFMSTAIPVSESDGLNLMQKMSLISTVSEPDQNSSLPRAPPSPFHSLLSLPLTIPTYPSHAAYPYIGPSMYPMHPSQVTHTYIGSFVYPTHAREVTQSFSGPTSNSALPHNLTQASNGDSSMYPTDPSQTAQSSSSPSTYANQVTYPFNGPSMYSARATNIASTASNKPVVMTGVAYPIDDSDDYQTNNYNNVAGSANQKAQDYSVQRTEDYDNDFEDGVAGDYQEEPKAVDYSHNYSNGGMNSYSDEEEYPESHSMDYPRNSNPEDKSVEYSDGGNARKELPDGHEMAASPEDRRIGTRKPAEYLDDFPGGKESYYVEDPPPDYPTFGKPVENPISGWIHRGRHRERVPPYFRRKLSPKNGFIRSKIDPKDPYLPVEERTTRGLSYSTERIGEILRGPFVTNPTDRRSKINEMYDDILDGFPEYFVGPPTYNLGLTTQQISESQSPLSNPLGHSIQNFPTRTAHPHRNWGPMMTVRPGFTLSDGYPETLTYNPHRSWMNNEFITAVPTPMRTRMQPITYGITGSLNCSLFHNPPISWSSEQLRAFGNNSRDSVALILSCGGRGAGRSDGVGKVLAEREGSGRPRNKGQKFRWDVSPIPVPPAKPTVPAEGIEPRRIFSQESQEDIKFVTDLIESQQEYRRAHQVVEFDIKPKLRSLARKKAETQSTDTWLCSHKGLGCNAYWYPVNAAISPSDVATEWYAESENYDFAAEPDLQRRPYVGLFTQMIWRSSMEVGCGRYELEDEKKFTIVCLYSPPGNEVGKFLDNVFPVPPPESGEGIQLADGSERSMAACIYLIALPLLLFFLPTKF